LLLFTAFPSLPDLLTSRVEVSTPISSFKRCTCSRIFWMNGYIDYSKCKKASFYTPGMSPHMTEVSSIRQASTSGSLE
jgi:hypothetical protein